MTDDTYKMSVRKIKAWVKAWASPDNLLNHDMYNLTGDAMSFCYMYWLEVNKKFTDNTEANKYYNATFLLKLSSYMNWFYKHKRTTREESPQALVYADALDEEDKPFWDALDLTYEEDKEPDINTFNKIIKLFIETTPSYHREIIRDIVHESLIAYRDRNNKEEKHNKRRDRNKLGINYNLDKICLKHHKSPTNISSIYSRQKDRFATDFPEIASYLESYDSNDIAHIFKETIVILRPGARLMDRHERLQAYLESRLSSVDTIVTPEVQYESSRKIQA